MIEFIEKYKYILGGILLIFIILISIYKYNKSGENIIIKDINEKKIIRKNDTETENTLDDLLNDKFKILINTLKNEINNSTQLLIKENNKQLEKNIRNEFINKYLKRDVIKKNILIDTNSIFSNIINYDTSEYKVTFGQENSAYSECYKNVIGFRLIKATIPHTIHKVTNNNNRIDYLYRKKNTDSSGISDSITLIPGNYTFNELGNHLIDTLNEKSFNGFTGSNQIIFDIISDNSSFKYVLEWNNQTFEIAFLWKTSFNNSSSSHILFGDNNVDYDFSENIMNIIDNTYTFPNIVNQSIHFVDLVIPEIPSIACKVSSNGRNVIDRIPLNSPSGTLVYYRSPEGELQTENFFNPIKLDSLTIQLFDNDSKQKYDSQNGHNSFEFEITIVHNTEHFI
tara:strand:+ start:1656 stop:2846 length:1191 start_codon:yes stop_codon:yes gene_type:complete